MELEGVAATNFKSVYTMDDGSCSFPGCMTEGNDNFKSFATFDDGSCARRRELGQERAQAVEGHRRLAAGCVSTTGFKPLRSLILASSVVRGCNLLRNMHGFE